MTGSSDPSAGKHIKVLKLRKKSKGRLRQLVFPKETTGGNVIMGKCTVAFCDKPPLCARIRSSLEHKDPLRVSLALRSMNVVPARRALQSAHTCAETQVNSAAAARDLTQCSISAPPPAPRAPSRAESPLLAHRANQS